MRLRASELGPLVDWLHDLLLGAALQGVRVPEAGTVVLSLRRPGRTVHLLVAARSGGCRVHTVERPPGNPKTPLALQGLLRKELGGVLTGLELVGGDRVVRLEFGQRALVAVLFDQGAELLLLDELGRVLGSSDRSRARMSDWRPPVSLAGAGAADRFDGLPGDDRDAAVRLRFEAEAQEQARAALRRRLVARRKGLARRADKQEAEADRGDEADQLQQRGDLLKSAFGRLRRGMQAVEVADFYDGGTRSIPLDPALEPKHNLDRLYARARKARRAGEEAGRRLLETLEEIDRLDEAITALDAAGHIDPADLAALLPKRGRRQRRRHEPRLPYRVYRAPSGAEIRVGRGARDNDDLTFRHSKGNDVWLHVRGRPGAHVVIRDPGPHPAPELLVVAAQVALQHSGIDGGAREEVAWTRVKWVRKPKGLPPGKVMPEQVKVLYVEADPAVVQALEQG